MSVLNIAKSAEQNQIKDCSGKNFDPRSYRLTPQDFKMKVLNQNIDYAVEVNNFFDKKLKNNPRFYSINWLKTKF